MNQIQIFQFEKQNIRTQLDENGNPWWVAKDVCEVLGLKNNRMALSSIPEDQKGVIKTTTLGGSQSLSSVSERGLYRLIFKSRKKEAVIFQDWVTEVLKTIRKTGSYSVIKKEPKPLTNIQSLLATVQAMAEMEARQADQDHRLVEIESRVMGSHNGQPISALGYLRINNHPSDNSTVMRFGKATARLARELGVNAFKVPDSRFGQVNGFYSDFYDQVAEEFFNAPNN